MKIAIDARELCGKPTGVGRYLAELLSEWADAPELHRHQWTLYANEPPVVPAAFRERVRLLPGAGGTRWEQWDFARRLGVDRPDVLFAPGYTAPLTAPCPIALTIHDVSFFARPGEFRWREGFRRRRITTWAARRARVIVTDSEFSRDQIVEHIGIPADRIRVIHLGMRSSLSGGASAAREPLVLYVGSIFPRRHVDRLVSVFGERVAPRVPGARLEIIGENRLPPDVNIDAWLEHLPEAVRARITFRSWVDEATLRDLYSRATVFAFLSDYEGFGLTPLEALAAGVPPIVLDTPVAREVYRSAALYVGRGQTPGTNLRTVENSELADALVGLLSDETKRAELLRQAPEVLARYRWDEAARLTLSAIAEAAGA
jgi:glycosyltransferase involved in cell wall biosynthesis